MPAKPQQQRAPSPGVIDAPGEKCVCVKCARCKGLGVLPKRGAGMNACPECDGTGLAGPCEYCTDRIEREEERRL